MRNSKKIFSDSIKEWNNKCPVCNACITFRLNSGEYGATSVATCGNNIGSARDFPRDKSERGKMKFCDWRGKAVRMRDGSVRFKDGNGRFLIEW